MYRGIFDNYGGASGKISNIYSGHYVGEVQILKVYNFPVLWWVKTWFYERIKFSGVMEG